MFILYKPALFLHIFLGFILYALPWCLGRGRISPSQRDYPREGSRPTRPIRLLLRSDVSLPTLHVLGRDCARLPGPLVVVRVDLSVAHTADCDPRPHVARRLQLLPSSPEGVGVALHGRLETASAG